MWDSAGLERYRALIPSYVRGASIIFIIYDISSIETFNNLGTWINFIKQVNTDNSILVLCGNKIDLPRQVSASDGQTLAEKENMLFFETSAKTGTGINNMMYNCISQLPFFEQYQDNKDSIIKELENNNSKMTEIGIYEINVDKNKNENVNANISQNIVLKNQENEKRNCGC